MEGTVFGPALDGMKHVKSEDGVMLTKPFLDVCKLIVPVIGNLVLTLQRTHLYVELCVV